MKIVSWTALLTVVAKRGYAPTVHEILLLMLYFLVFLFFPIDAHTYSVFSVSRMHAYCPQTVLTWDSKFAYL